jgi:hypothetical protein
MSSPKLTPELRKALGLKMHSAPNYWIIPFIGPKPLSDEATVNDLLCLIYTTGKLDGESEGMWNKAEEIRKALYIDDRGGNE